jgi:hypothetical protein
LAKHVNRGTWKAHPNNQGAGKQVTNKLSSQKKNSKPQIKAKTANWNNLFEGKSQARGKPLQDEN